MGIYNGVRNLDSSKNSGNFLLGNLLIKDASGSWGSWVGANTQVDNPCGTAPTCLQGWWSQTPPPYTNRNIGKPAQ